MIDFLWKRTTNLKNVVYSLVALFVVAFLTGFLQDTEFEFVIYVSYFILLAVGVKLIIMTLKSKATVVLKGFLLLLGFSTTVYFLFFVFAVLKNILYGIDITETMELTEDILYLVSLLLLIGVTGSIVLFKTSKKYSEL